MNQYMAYFDFNTVHGGGNIVGRSGQCAFESENDMLQVLKDFEEIKSLCAGFVLRQKPKWKILMITVTDIKMLNSEQSVKVSDTTEAQSMDEPLLPNNRQQTLKSAKNLKP